MKKLTILFGLVLALTSQVSIAEYTSSLSKKISLNINYNYYSLNQSGKTSQTTIKNVINLQPNQREWTLIGGVQSHAPQSKKQGTFVLFGKIENADAKKVKVKFLSVMLNDKNQLASESAMVMPYGEHEQIQFEQGKGSVQIDVIANN